MVFESIVGRRLLGEQEARLWGAGFSALARTICSTGELRLAASRPFDLLKPGQQLALLWKVTQNLLHLEDQASGSNLYWDSAVVSIFALIYDRIEDEIACQEYPDFLSLELEDVYQEASPIHFRQLLLKAASESQQFEKRHRQDHPEAFIFEEPLTPKLHAVASGYVVQNNLADTISPDSCDRAVWARLVNETLHRIVFRHDWSLLANFSHGQISKQEAMQICAEMNLPPTYLQLDVPELDANASACMHKYLNQQCGRKSTERLDVEHAWMSTIIAAQNSANSTVQSQNEPSHTIETELLAHDESNEQILNIPEMRTPSLSPSIEESGFDHDENGQSFAEIERITETNIQQEQSLYEISRQSILRMANFFWRSKQKSDAEKKFEEVIMSPKATKYFQQAMSPSKRARVLSVCPGSPEVNLFAEQQLPQESAATTAQPPNSRKRAHGDDEDPELLSPRRSARLSRQTAAVGFSKPVSMSTPPRNAENNVPKPVRQLATALKLNTNHTADSASKPSLPITSTSTTTPDLSKPVAAARVTSLPQTPSVSDSWVATQLLFSPVSSNSIQADAAVEKEVTLPVQSIPAVPLMPARRRLTSHPNSPTPLTSSPLRKQMSPEVETETQLYHTACQSAPVEVESECEDAKAEEEEEQKSASPILVYHSPERAVSDQIVASETPPMMALSTSVSLPLPLQLETTTTSSMRSPKVCLMLRTPSKDELVFPLDGNQTKPPVRRKYGSPTVAASTPSPSSAGPKIKSSRSVMSPSSSINARRIQPSRRYVTKGMVTGGVVENDVWEFSEENQ